MKKNNATNALFLQAKYIGHESYVMGREPIFRWIMCYCY